MQVALNSKQKMILPSKIMLCDIYASSHPTPLAYLLNILSNVIISLCFQPSIRLQCCQLHLTHFISLKSTENTKKKSIWGSYNVPIQSGCCLRRKLPMLTTVMENRLGFGTDIHFQVYSSECCILSDVLVNQMGLTLCSQFLKDHYNSLSHTHTLTIRRSKGI